MPTKILQTQADRTGTQQEQYRFGGGDDVIFANDDGLSPFGYWINGFKGSDTIYGSDSDHGDMLIGGEGNDTVFGGAGSDTIHGGNLDGSDTVKGPADTATNILVGDGARDPLTGELVGTLSVSGAFGIVPGDTIFGGNGSVNLIYGDYVTVNLDLGATYTGGDDTLTGGAGGAENDVFGDAATVVVGAGAAFTGGVDAITGGQDSVNRLYGDAGAGLDGASSLQIAAGGSFTGGHDVITGGAGTDAFTADNEIYGDTSGTVVLAANAAIGGDATLAGGDDTITGGAGAENEMYGDFFQVTITDNNRVTGGNDTVTGGDAIAGFANQNLLYGDARTAFFTGDGTGQHFVGGDDALTGGDGSRGTIYGDVRSVTMTAGATFEGGDDTITGGANGPGLGVDNTLIGDAATISGAGTVTGGNDTLISGENSTDWLYGDWLDDFTGIAVGGADTFVFGTQNGLDIIKDFEDGKDTIDLMEAGVVWNDLDTSLNGELDNGDAFVTISGADTVIDLGAARGEDPGVHMVTVEGVTGLTGDDFDFLLS